jgi:PEP-CTERM motif
MGAARSGGGDAFPGLAGGLGSAGNNGGFGGGGGGIGGGGGGYSGGGGGACAHFFCSGGGGGGSFDAGTDQILVANFQTGNGEVVITELAAGVPEPSSLVLLGAGVLALAAMRRKRTRS